MARRALPAALAFAAVVADLGARHGWALAFLLLAIPAAFAHALGCYGDALEGRCGGLRPLIAALAAVLLVVSAALRSPAVVGGVPHLAVSAAVLAVMLYVAMSLGASALGAVERLVVERASAAAEWTVRLEGIPAGSADDVDDRRGRVDEPAANVDAYA
jgi:hypothetical protein